MTLPPIDGQRYFRFISQKTDGGSVLRWLGDVGRIYRHQELYSDAVAALAFAEGVPLIDVRPGSSCPSAICPVLSPPTASI